jgi:FAD:protein FMN transferase
VVRVPGIVAELSQRRSARQLSAAVAAGLTLLASLFACQAAKAPLAVVRDGRLLMGTLLQATVLAGDEAHARAAAEACFALGAELEAVLTTYDAASATSRMNASAGAGPFAAPPALARIVEESRRLTRETSGAFDPSVGPLIELWSAAARGGHLPASGEIAAARRRVGMERIRVETGGRVTLEPGMAVNFGGVGKGFALDRMREELAARGVTNALLDFGGSSWLALGVPADAPAWRVLLRDGRGGFAGAVTLRDASASFSESFGEWSEIEGRRLGHVIDPRTGWPMERPRAAFAVAADGAAAEALTKALLVLDTDEALAVVARFDGAEALVIDAAGARHASPGFGRALRFEPAR